ncbi:hypothetical protein [Vibrio sp. AND4]|uniref:hypothetical protein n=1 Tax=Vibrio sp. AND4 TaxID=314289 RepID=UPI00015F228C|nr:hypothetical protein [Vibrio sp. AND4]EDP58528.1 predicted response regulator in two-component system withYehU [Vibrio sp. AND4]
MKKIFLVALMLFPLTVSASNVLKESVKMKRKYDHDKHHITNTVKHTKRNIKEVTDGTYVENQVKREVNQTKRKYTDKVDNVKNITNPDHIKRKANDKLNKEFDEWLYED